jgi:hypothetical protein
VSIVERPCSLAASAEGASLYRNLCYACVDFLCVHGGTQTFSLHETTPGSSYEPPAWIATLAQLHKKQTTMVPPRRPRPIAPEGALGDRQRGGAQQTPPPAPNGGGQAVASQKSHLPMKIFFFWLP